MLEIPGNYPKNICFSVWGEKIDQFALQTGDQIQASIDLESKEYNGRWYTEVKAWKTSKSGSGTETTTKQAAETSIEDNLDTPF